MGLLCRNKITRVGRPYMVAVLAAEGFAHHLLGKAGAFATLAGNPEGFPHIAIAAATCIDSIADLTVGNTLAEANVHR